MSSLTHSRTNITIEERRTTTRLAKEVLRNVSLSGWSSFMEAIKLVQEDVLTS